MIDRTSAFLFEKVFTFLARNHTDENKAFTKELAGMTSKYGFHNYQMYADEALIKLGLAHLAPHPDNTGDDMVVYDF